MSARRPVRRTLTAFFAALALGAGFLAAAAPADAAGPWFVAPAPTGNNAATCLSAAAPCATVAGVLAKGTFASGDTINVAPGTYVGATTFTAKGANVVGSGPGVIFDGGNTGTTSTMAVTGAVTVNLTNLTLRNGFNNSTGGGGLRVQVGTVTTTNVVFSGNKSTVGGAAVVYPGTVLNVSAGSITGNSSTAIASLQGAGGGIYVFGQAPGFAAGKLTLNGVSVTNNVALGATLLASGNGGAVFNAGTTVITGSTFSGNQAGATSAASKVRSGQGGSLFNGPNDADDLPSLQVDTTTITGGLAPGAFNSSSGGAIANVETSTGGTSASGVLTMSGTTLTGNTAILGGGLYNGGTATITNGAINNSAAFSGAGIYQSPIVLGTASASATINGTTFANNVATGSILANYGNGGAIFNAEKLTISNAHFTGNKAVASTAGGTATGWGGAIWNGPFLAGDAPELTITNTDIQGGAVSGGNAVIGGAIATTGNVFSFPGAVPATMTADNLVVSGNAALAGGAIYAGGKVTLVGGALDHNSATNTSIGYGGAVYSVASPASDPAPVLKLTGVQVTHNTAAVAGGGLALLSKVDTDLTGATNVDNNTAAVLGGGVYNTGKLKVTNSTVDGNDTGFQGGGIYNGPAVATDTPSLTLVDASIDDNTAANAGGGLVTVKGATLTATGGHISGNSALGGGGVVVGDAAPASFDGTDFVNNTASALGGGALLNSGSTTIAHATLSANHALHTTGNTGLGGAIYSGSSTTNAVTSLKIEASTIAGNDAYSTSALLLFSTGTGATNTTSIDRSTITGNTSEANVGAIAQFHPLTITSSTITDNTAVGGSGGLTIFAPATAGIAGTIVSGNSGPECAGAAVDGGYNLTDAGDPSCGFVAATNVHADPQLGALVDNGGSTDTRKPGPSSPALDKVSAGTATPLTNAVSGTAVSLCGAGFLDQRDVARPQGAKCDIGAVEVVQVAPTVDGPDTADYSVGSAGAPLTFTTTGTPKATLAASVLPAGLHFTDNGDGTGTLSGTPAVGTGGDYTITVTATNEAGPGSTTLALTIHEAPILTGPSASTYRVGQLGGPDEFKQTAGHPEAILSTTSTLPGGVDFTPQPGGKATIGGTPTAGTGGVYPITVKGSNGTPPDATWPFTLTVEEAPGLTGPATATFTVGTSGSSGEFVAGGFPAPTLTAAGLPGGLHLDGTGPGKAKITGQAANGTGGVYDVTVTAANGVGAADSEHVTVTVNEAPEITGPATVRFVAGFSGLTVFSADGFPGASLSRTGGLPAGVTFVDNNNGTATLSGIPAGTSVGTYHFTVRASNGVDPDATLEVTLEVAPPLAIQTSTLPDAAVGTAYGSPVVATGGLPPYTFTKTGGSLPPGLTLQANGTVTGTPTGPAGTSTFEVKVADSATPQQTVTKQIQITVTKGDSALAVDPLLIQNIFTWGVTVRIGTVGATLTGGSPGHPIAGQTVVFKAGLVTVCQGVTDVNGRVSCTMNAVNTLLAILNLGVSATYAGNTSWKPASGSALLF
jgi:hypothetical protein